MKNKTSGKWLYRAPLILQTIIWIPTRILLIVFMRLDVRGTEYLRKLKRPVIFAVNHSSEWDPILVPAALPFLSPLSGMFYTSREREFYEKKGPQALFYGGIFFKLWGAYPVKIGMKNYERSLRQHIDILENKVGSICFFPEGAKTKDGNLLPAKGGISYLAHRTKTTIVPVVLHGHFKMTKSDFFLRRRVVTVTFGASISPEILFPSDSFVAHPEYRVVAERVMKKLSILL